MKTTYTSQLIVFLLNLLFTLNLLLLLSTQCSQLLFLSNYVYCQYPFQGFSTERKISEKEGNMGQKFIMMCLFWNIK